MEAPEMIMPIVLPYTLSRSPRLHTQAECEIRRHPSRGRNGRERGMHMLPEALLTVSKMNQKVKNDGVELPAHLPADAVANVDDLLPQCASRCISVTRAHTVVGQWRGRVRRATVDERTRAISEQPHFQLARVKQKVRSPRQRATVSRESPPTRTCGLWGTI